jgi:hypothetical protein
MGAIREPPLQKQTRWPDAALPVTTTSKNGKWGLAFPGTARGGASVPKRDSERLWIAEIL